MGALAGAARRLRAPPVPGAAAGRDALGPACRTCSTIAMADLERLVTLVHAEPRAQADLADRVRLPDEPARPLPRRLADEAGEHVASAARRVAPRAVRRHADLLPRARRRGRRGLAERVHDRDGVKKPAYTAFRFPLVRTSRSGAVVGLWGQIRPRADRSPTGCGSSAAAAGAGSAARARRTPAVCSR